MSQCLACHYGHPLECERPADAPGVCEPGSDRPTLAERLDPIAAAVHEEWVQSRILGGYTEYRGKDGANLMVPYDDLSEEAKDLDRWTAFAVLDTLVKQGHLPSIASVLDRQAVTQ